MFTVRLVLALVLFLLLAHKPAKASTLENFRGTDIYLYRIRNRTSDVFFRDTIPRLIAANPALNKKVELLENKENDTLLFQIPDPNQVEILQEYLSQLDLYKDSNESSIIKLQYSQAEAIATYLQKIFGLYEEKVMGNGKVARTVLYHSDKMKVVADESSNSILLEGPHYRVNEAKKIIQSIDYRTPQVLIEVLISEVTLNHDESLGIDWEFNGRGLGGRNVQNQATVDYGNISSNPRAGNNRSNLQGLKFSLLNPADFEVFLQNVEQTNRIQILSRPKILTANNKSAVFKATQQNPVLKTTNADGVVNNSVDYLDIGIDLQVTPRINKDNYISMQILQIIQEITGTDPTALNSPIYSERKVQSELLVKDSHTIIIGGLISSSNVEGESRVPILGSLPVLKRFFRRKTVDRKKTEMLIFITPHIIRDYNSADDVTYLQTQGVVDKDRIQDFIDESEEYRKSLLRQEKVVGEVVHIEDEKSNILVQLNQPDLAREGSSFIVVRQGKHIYDNQTHQLVGTDFDYVATITLIQRQDGNLFSAVVQEGDQNRQEILVGDLVRKPTQSFLNSATKHKINSGNGRLILHDWDNVDIEVTFELENIDRKPMEEMLLADGVLTKDSKFVDPSGKRKIHPSLIETKSNSFSFKLILDPPLEAGEKMELGYITPLPEEWRKSWKKKKQFRLNSSNNQDFLYDFLISPKFKIQSIEPEPVASLKEGEYTLLRFYKPREKMFQRVLIKFE